MNHELHELLREPTIIVGTAKIWRLRVGIGNLGFIQIIMQENEGFLKTVESVLRNQWTVPYFQLLSRNQEIEDSKFVIVGRLCSGGHPTSPN